MLASRRRAASQATRPHASLANSHCTITSALVQAVSRVSEKAVEHRSRSGEGKVGDDREDLARPAPAARVGLDDPDVAPDEAPAKLGREGGIDLQRGDGRPCVEERRRQDTGPGAYVDGMLTAADAGLPNEIRCKSLTAEEVLAARFPCGSLPDGHGRPPSSSRGDSTRGHAADPLDVAVRTKENPSSSASEGRTPRSESGRARSAVPQPLSRFTRGARTDGRARRASAARAFGRRASGGTRPSSASGTAMPRPRRWRRPRRQRAPLAALVGSGFHARPRPGADARRRRRAPLVHERSMPQRLDRRTRPTPRAACSRARLRSPARRSRSP